MATRKNHQEHWQEVSPWRAIITSAFYASNVREIQVHEAYHLARQQPGIIETDELVYDPQSLGLPDDAHVLVVNDGDIIGRTAKARKVVDHMTAAEKTSYQTLLREAAWELNQQEAIRAQAVVGMDPHFMVRAHLLTLPKYAMDTMNWLVNFTPYSLVEKSYAKSRDVDGFDIAIMSSPDWRHPDHPNGLVIVDPSNQCAAILGLRYFGEKKKATLTLTWALGVSLGMVACHSGVKKVKLKEGDDFVEKSISFFGLSGSGKSSLTNNQSHGGLIDHDAGEEVTIVHDDAYLVDLAENVLVALEPTLFDKTDATDPGGHDIDFWISAQNQFVAKDNDGRLRVIPRDVRNKNGRAIKSRDWIGNIDNTAQAPKFVCWLMKDELLPPIVKLSDPAMAVAMGACLSTKRTAAENVSAAEMNKLVIEPFANPFRVYPLATDCERFHDMFEKGCEGFILNTGAFMGNDVTKEMSLELVVRILREDLEYQDWLPGMQLAKDYFDKTFTPPTTKTYWKDFISRANDRLEYLTENKAPDWVIKAISDVKVAAEKKRG